MRLGGTTQLWLRVPREMRRALIEVAAEHGTTMSAVAVRALDLYLRERCGMERKEIALP